MRPWWIPPVRAGVAAAGIDEELVPAGPIVIDVDGKGDLAVFAHFRGAADLGVIAADEQAGEFGGVDVQAGGGITVGKAADNLVLFPVHNAEVETGLTTD